MALLKKDLGFISLLILLILVFLSWQGLQFYYKLYASEKMTRYEAERVKATFLADSGLEWGKYNLDQNTTWSGGSKTMTEGRIDVTVTQSNQEYRIVALAQVNSCIHKVYGVFQEMSDGNLHLIRYGELYD